MRLPLPHELVIARELAELAILDTALRVVCDVLIHEHPTIRDPGEGDPPSLHAARTLFAGARLLHRRLRSYRAAVLASPIHDDDPFPF